MGKLTHKNHIEAHTIKIIVLCMIMLIAFPLISGLEFDNSKDIINVNKGEAITIGDREIVYNSLWEKYPAIEINNWFGIGETLMQGAITNHDESCGTDCSSEMQIYIANDGALIDDVEFVGGSIKSYQFYIKTGGTEWLVDDYVDECNPDGTYPNGTEKITCSQVKVGNHYENDYTYTKYELGEEVEAGTYYIKLEGERSSTSHVDWQITTQGKLLTEWAVWGDFVSSFDSLVTSTQGVGSNGSVIVTVGVGEATFKLFELDGTPIQTIAPNASNTAPVGIDWNGTGWLVTDATSNRIYSYSPNFEYLSSCISPVAATLIGVETNGTSIWITDVSAGKISELDMSCNLLKTFTTYMTAPQGIAMNGSHLFVLDATADNVTMMDFAGNILNNFSLHADNTNGYGLDISGNFFYTADSVTEKVYKYLSTFIDDGINPRLTLISPTSIIDYGTAPNETLSWNATDSDLETVWFNYNGINTTLTTSSGNIVSTTFALATAPYNLTLYANDTFGNTNSSFIEWEYRLFQTGEKFTTPTSSGALNEFILNITTDGNAITIARLNYNGTDVLGSITSDGNEYTLTRNQIAPGVSAPTNISFFWNITQGGINIATDTQNQTVNPIVINGTCTGMSTIFNLTLADERTQSKLDGDIFNVSIKVNLDLFTSDRTLQLGSFFEAFSGTNPVGICINNNLSNEEMYSLDLQIQYSADNHSIEFYNIQDQTLDEDTLVQNITLFDLDIPNTQKFKLRVRDTSFLPIDGGLVKIERKYLENGTFFTTEIPKTDENGITSANLQLNDVIYNFFIFDSGVLLSSFTNVLAICQTPLVSECEIDFNAFQSEITIPNFEEGDDFNFTLGYNDSSRVVSSQFIIPSGEPSVIKLVVIREDTLGTSVCEDTITTSAGTLTCIVPSSFGNSTVLARILKDDVEQGKGNIKLDQKSEDIFPGVLVFLSLLVIMTLIGISVSDSPVITAVFLFVGVLLLVGINLIENTGFIGETATILFFAIAVILVLIKAGRRS